MLDVIILAGGLGTRLREVVSDVPKPMALVTGKPFLDFLLEQVMALNVMNVILSTGYKSDKIKNYYQKRGFLFSEEESPLGTGGAVKKALKLAKSSHVLVMNGDSYFGLDLEEMHKHHLKKQAELTIACKKVDDISRYGSIAFDENFCITAFCEKRPSIESGWINGGIYILERKLLDPFPEMPFSLEKECFPKLLNNRVFAYPSDSKFLDIGTKESYLEAEKFFR